MHPRPRSAIYVPASSGRRLARRASLGADAAIVDLEDGVDPAGKEAARERVRAELRRDPAPLDALRVNPPGTPWHEADLELAREVRPGALVLPKAERVEAVDAVARAVAGRCDALALTIETAAGLAAAVELAAHPSVRWLLLGSADFRLSLGAPAPDDPADRAWETALLDGALVAARAGGAAALDGVYFRFRDEAGLRRHASPARARGYDGKTCIHPAQVGPIHEVWAPAAGELRWARAVVAAWESRDRGDAGVLVVDGEMIEELHVRLARALLERADAAQGDGAP